MTTSTEWLALAERYEKATGPDREIDRSVAFKLGVGVEKERNLYAKIGHAMWVIAANGLTPYDEARGDRIRNEWQKGTRRNPGRYMPVRINICDGPMPLTDCARITGSLDAIVALIERELPDWWYQIESAVYRGDRLTAKPIVSIGHYLFDVAGCDDVEAATPALALCASLCRAMAAQCEERGE